MTRRIKLLRDAPQELSLKLDAVERTFGAAQGEPANRLTKRAANKLASEISTDVDEQRSFFKKLGLKVFW